jgi:hypothetical protein
MFGTTMNAPVGMPPLFDIDPPYAEMAGKKIRGNYSGLSRG